MKLAFNEADMGKCGMVTIMLSLLIANLPLDGAKGKITPKDSQPKGGQLSHLH